MSLSESIQTLLPARMQLTLATDGVHLQRLDWRGRASGTRTHLPLAAARPDTPLWQPWLDALKTWLASRAGQRFEFKVLLSDRFVRYQHLPWRAGISGRRERQAYAGHRFREVYGELAVHWQIALSDNAPGTASMACAMDRELLAALKGLGKQVRISSVQPMFVAAYNRARRQCKGGLFWFAHVEPGRVCMALLKAGESAGVRNEASSESWPQAVVAINRRLQLGDDMAATPVPVYVSGDLQGLPMPQLLGNNPVHHVAA